MGLRCLHGVVCWEPRVLRLCAQAVGKGTSSAVPGSSCGKQPFLNPVVVPVIRAHKPAGKASHILLTIQEQALFPAIKVQLLPKQHGQKQFISKAEQCPRQPLLKHQKHSKGTVLTWARVLSV